MTRIARDWMRTATAIDPLRDEVAEGPSTRALLRGQFVQVMADVARGCRRSPRAAFLQRPRALVASRLGLGPHARSAGTGRLGRRRPPDRRAALTTGSRRPADSCPNPSQEPPPASATGTS